MKDIYIVYALCLRVLTPGKKSRSSGLINKFKACNLVAVFIFHKCFNSKRWQTLFIFTYILKSRNSFRAETCVA
jgi:hypothetical protein